MNCCVQAEVLAAVQITVAASGRPAIAYPNARETWDAENHEWVGASSYDLAHVPAWRKATSVVVAGSTPPPSRRKPRLRASVSGTGSMLVPVVGIGIVLVGMGDGFMNMGMAVPGAFRYRLGVFVGVVTVMAVEVSVLKS